jgi:hypothetical protein
MPKTKKITKKKKKSLTLAQLRKIADKLYQEVGRKNYDKCLVCKKPMSCLHHYYPKSTSSALRYDMLNGIPICFGCHCQHHQGSNPEIHNRINAIMGEEWLQELNKRKNEIIKVNKAYYLEIIETFKKLLN